MAHNMPPTTVRMVRQDEADIVHRVHLEALSDLTSEQARRDNLSHFISHIAGLGMIFGCYTPDEEMVAYGVVGLQSDITKHIEQLLGVQEADHARFCILDGAAVKPAWRGQQLQRSLIQCRLTHCAQLGRTLIGVTVSPSNIFSLLSLIGENFTITRFSFLYGGSARLVLQRDLHIPPARWRAERLVQIDDVTAHQSALAMGLVGFECTQGKDGQWQVHYGQAA